MSDLSPALLPEGLRDRLPPEAEALGRMRASWASALSWLVLPLVWIVASRMFFKRIEDKGKGG